MLVLMLAAAAINVPFGYWRSGARRFSRAWFFHVHASIPLVVTLRMAAGIEWTMLVGVLLVASYVAGQKAGAAVRGARERGK